jgi:hypothetical protein
MHPLNSVGTHGALETRSEPGIDFIQEIQIQSVGASAEYGNLQGAVINVITRQGGERVQCVERHDGRGIVTDALTTATIPRVPRFGMPNVFVDPRRAVVGMRIDVGRP